MITLNLVKKEESDIKYHVSPFPDSQKNVTIDKDSVFAHPFGTPVVIKSRMAWDDVQVICSAVASLRRLRVKEIHLYVPYFLGARSDRRFEIGGNNYIGDVISPIINRLRFDSVTVLDAHSYCLDTGVKNLENNSNYDLVKWALNDMSKNKVTDINNEIIFISPDNGATHKIRKLAKELQFDGDIIECSKERDEKGELSLCLVPMGNLWTSSKNLVLVDDVLDGGRTFMNIAKEVKSNGYKGKLFLIVSHGIFSHGFGELQQYFDYIYTTNSVKDLPSDTIEFIKQLDVF